MIFKVLLAKLKANLLAVLGLAGTLLGIAISYYFYEQSLRVREPVFVVDSRRVEILSARKVSIAPIRVLRQDGSRIDSSLYAVQFYLWNRGKESIRATNILDSLRVEFSDSASQIIDAKILRQSRPFVNAGISFITRGVRSNELAVSFSVLDQDDGFAAQVIYQGSPDVPLSIHGSIEGTTRIQTDQDVPTVPVLLKIVELLFSFLVLITIAMLALFVIGFLGSRTAKLVSAHLSEPSIATVKKYGPKVIVIVVMLLFGYFIVSSVVRNVASTVSREIPRDLISK